MGFWLLPFKAFWLIMGSLVDTLRDNQNTRGNLLLSLSSLLTEMQEKNLKAGLVLPAFVSGILQLCL